MSDLQLNPFAGNASMLVGVGFVAFVVLALVGPGRLFHGVLAVASLVAFAVVLGMTATLARGSPAWTLWGSSLGLFGLALSAIVQTSLLLGVDRQQLRAQMVLTISTVAAWVLITSLVALADRDWPAAWSWVGIALSLMWAGLIPAQQLGVRMAGMALSAGATVLASIWFIWAGALLRGAGGDSPQHVDRGAA
ncbi:MAG: hypothetical protein M3O70_00930 [Actinomycetota bacterium]|nr:hypothetical protein [Actinomycetota bacterium]